MPVRGQWSVQKRQFASVLVIRVKSVVDDSHRDTHCYWPKTFIARKQESNSKHAHSGDETYEKSVGNTR